MKCVFKTVRTLDDGRHIHQCVACGLTTNPTPHTADRVHARCTAKGVGDWIKNWLLAIGLTPLRWLKAMNTVRRAVGRPEASSCGCEQRQEFINERCVWLSVLIARLRGWLVLKIGI